LEIVDIYKRTAHMLLRRIQDFSTLFCSTRIYNEERSTIL